MTDETRHITPQKENLEGYCELYTEIYVAGQVQKL